MTTELDLVRENAPALRAPQAGSSAAAMDMLRGHAEVMQMAFDLASSMVKTSMVPTHFRLKPEDATAAILYGMELGLSPIQSLQQVIAVHGKPTVEARTMVGLLKAKGYRFKVHENTDTVATIQGWSPDGVEDETVTWTIEDAIKAEFVPQIDPDTGKYALNSNNKLKGNMKYLTQPRQMLYAKAAGELCRHLAPDALLGIAYSHEDLTSEPEPVRVTSERVSPVSTGNAKYAEAVQGMPEDWKQSAPTGLGVPVQQWQPPAEEEKPAETASEEGVKPDTSQVDDPAQASPEPGVEMATVSEQRALAAELERHGHKTPAAKRKWLGSDTGREIASAKELTGEEARGIITRLSGREAGDMPILATQWAESVRLLDRLGSDTDELKLAFLRGYLNREDITDPLALNEREGAEVLAELIAVAADEAAKADGQ